MGTKVRDVMTTRPRAVTADTPVTQVAELMEAEDVGAIPVLEGEQLTAIVTDRDIVLRAVAKGKDPRGMPVREVFSTEIVTVGPDQDLSDALQIMASPPGEAAAGGRRRQPARRCRLAGRCRPRGEGEVRRRDGGGDLAAAGRPAPDLGGATNDEQRASARGSSTYIVKGEPGAPSCSPQNARTPVGPSTKRPRRDCPRGWASP